MAFDPADSDRIYITSNMIGVFVSDDAGDHWKWSSYGASNQLGGIALDPSDPNTLYALGPEGIFQSTDKAKHWHLIYSKGNGYKGINNEYFVSLKNSLFGSPGQSIAVSPKGVVYVSTVVGDVIISRDRGRTFERITIGKKGPVKIIIPIDDRKVSAALYNEGIFLSMDEGKHWKNILPSGRGNILAIAVHPEKRKIMYALVSEKPITPHDSTLFCEAHMYRSDDEGEEWKLVHSFNKFPIRRNRRMMDVSREGTIVVLTARGPVRSEDSGRTWSQTGIEGKKTDRFIYEKLKGKPSGPLSIYADLHKDRRWYMTDMIAAYRSDDDGRTWHYKVNGLREQAYWFVKVNPKDPKIIVASDLDHGLIRSSDGGITWRDIVIVHPFEECDQLRFSPDDPTYSQLYAFFYHPYPFIAKSMDMGETWSILNDWNQKGWMSMTRFAIARGETVPEMYIGEPRVGIWKSTDEGKTWVTANKGLPRPEDMDYIQFLESDGRGYIYVGIASDTAGRGGIYRSTDNGNSWFPLNQRLGRLFVRRGSFEIDPNDPDILWVGNGRAVYMSKNGGKSWEMRIQGIYSSAILVEPGNSDNVYVASFTGGGILKQFTAGIYKSVDGGNYFFKMSDELLQTIGTSYRLNDLEYGWRGPHGIWAAPNGGGLIYTTSPFTND
jgi:photosystem II stability/assembly factor-like uncharacterized protein